MQVSLNSSIVTNNKYQNCPSHKAVIPKYVNEAQRQMNTTKCVNYRTIQELIDATFIFKKYLTQDAVDTLKKIQEFAPNVKEAIDSDLKALGIM